MTMMVYAWFETLLQGSYQIKKRVGGAFRAHLVRYNSPIYKHSMRRQIYCLEKRRRILSADTRKLRTRKAAPEVTS
jgi:hypothetical protein